MLSKLMKYEVKATQRIFLPMYALIIVFAGINKLFMQLNFQRMDGMFSVATGISMVVYVILIAATFVMTLVVMIQRFYKNLLGDEGYLSFTLPVKVHSHIDCKMLVSLMWNILSIVVALLSVFILAVSTDMMKETREILDGIGRDFQQYGGMAWLVTVEVIVLVLVSILACTLQIYASITVGNYSSKHKLLAGFGAFIGFGVVQQIVCSILLGAYTGGQQMDDFLHSHALTDWAMLHTVAGWFGAAILFDLVFGAAFYFLTNWLLSKKLNLE